ncbi:type 1 glutamine amidotransferase domain-containing protein [Acanthopleuribacter pedis]|uniref:Type 1 glutamine amidotransferase domain-containing protein n=1 Tax=Acanthopleuribacter pedis TaxID=442870 RepID=A0A8J7Q6F6_9BACT|nr:type 1 glutamine amidotransferase domain-containing protein [Acanthopleuribacter pedis]MBO1321382.1 type 1 glutamine amidotransferase domain-containing protein [Acanthopleuribacter pedis]
MILIFLTNHAELAGEPNGTFSTELTHALHVFEEAGFAYQLASIQGGAAPVYGQNAEDKVDTAVHADPVFQKAIQNTKPAAELKAEDYSAVFYPGGYGVLFDLAKHEGAAAITARIYEAGGVVGAVCHGPAGLLPVTLSDGRSLLEGRTVTSFTRAEEVAFNTLDKIPYVLEDALLAKAARFIRAENWAENVAVAERVVTGQNPASAGAVAEAMVAAIRQPAGQP